MGSERAIFKAISKTFVAVGTVISEMQVHSLTKKLQSNSRYLNIISISLRWTDSHGYEAFGIIKVESAML